VDEMNYMPMDRRGEPLLPADVEAYERGSTVNTSIKS